MSRNRAALPGSAIPSRALGNAHRARCTHEWRLVSDDVDEFGPVRMFECGHCGRTRFS
jgi:hypothetical protein